MKSKILGLLAVGLLAAPLLSQAAPVISNGSLTGPLAQGGVPTGWATYAGSPDTNDVNNNVGGGTPFAVAPSGPSPDGGTWVGIGIGTSGFFEEFGQVVSGFDGSSYTLSWFAGNFGAVTGPGYDAPNLIDVLLNGTLIGSGYPLPVNANWWSQSLTFAAPSGSNRISFRLSDGTANSYMSIDGISFTAASVPEPGTLALLSLGLAGLGLSRRRRA